MHVMVYVMTVLKDMAQRSMLGRQYSQVKAVLRSASASGTTSDHVAVTGARLEAEQGRYTGT